MKNRIASLFALDTLLGKTGNGHGAAAHSPAHGRKRKAHTPARPCPPAQSTAQGAAVRSFDKGDPIHCEHDVAYKPVARVDVGEPPSAPQGPDALQLGDDYDVEAFEEPDEDLEPRLSGEDEAEAEPLGMASGVAWDDEPGYHPPTEESAQPVVAQSVSFRKPATFAAEMTAVERDLADLAARATQPPPEASAPDAPPPGDSGAEPSPAPAPKPSGHAVFDQMAQGMGYATEFRLPPVQLSQVFSALDRQLDAEALRPAVPAPVAGSPVPADPVAAAPTSETLIKDLVALPETQPAVESAPLTTPA